MRLLLFGEISLYNENTLLSTDDVDCDGCYVACPLCKKIHSTFIHFRDYHYANVYYSGCPIKCDHFFLLCYGKFIDEYNYCVKKLSLEETKKIIKDENYANMCDCELREDYNYYSIGVLRITHFEEQKDEDEKHDDGDEEVKLVKIDDTYDIKKYQEDVASYNGICDCCNQEYESCYWSD